MLHIARSEQQGDMSPFHQLAQLGHGLFPTLGCQFRFVAFAKFREFVRIVAKPLAKFIARCDLLQPGINACPLFGKSTRPEPVH